MGSTSDGSGRTPRNTHLRRLRLSQEDYDKLGVASRILGTSRTRLIHFAMRQWLYAFGRDVVLARPRRVQVARCPHASTIWQPHTDEPMFCPACARPVCERCRRFYRVVALDVTADGDGIGIYEQGCACPRT